MKVIKSKQRVADHGEAFTPEWLIESLLELVKGKTDRIDSRFLEPACGSGNCLVLIHALLAVMCCYGIELLADTIAECRANLLEILTDYLKIDESNDLYRAASYVLSQNLVHGDELKMCTHDDQPITFAEWAPSAVASPGAATSVWTCSQVRRRSAHKVRSLPTSPSTKSLCQ